MDLEKKEVEVVEETKKELVEEFDVLNLPKALGARRNILEKELHKTILEIVENSLLTDLTELFKNFGQEGEFTINWDFYPENDDNGGSYMSITDIHVISANDSEFDPEEVFAEVPYTHTDGTYRTDLYDKIYDFMSANESDIYEVEVDKITFTVPKGE